MRQPTRRRLRFSRCSEFRVLADFAFGFRRQSCPRPNNCAPYLFPSVIATTVDEHGFRLLAREAFPFVSLGNPGSLKSTIKLSGAKGFKPDRKLSFNLGLLK